MSGHAKFLILNPVDDVMVALQALQPGEQVDGTAILDPVPFGHKVARRALAKGQPVKRYGQIIGFATQDITAGQHVHTHNLEFQEFDKDYRFSADYAATEMVAEPDTFMGIVRPDGRVATRNYIGILTSVNCSARVAQAVAEHFRRDLRPEALADYPQVDGVVALTHGAGCGIDSTGRGLEVLQRTIAGYVRHPNFAGLLIIGLGCETNQISALMKAQALEESNLLRTFNIQDVGGTPKSIARGIELIKRMLPEANRVQRTRVPVSHLKIGLQCGGSDSFSGITANPVLGAAADILVRNGGTVILAETPEIYGAEHLLTCRAVTPAVGQKLVDVFDWWEDLCHRNNASMNNNPSAGNKKGGLTTVLEKSLGGVSKGGTTGLMAVYDYAEAVVAKGLVFMNTPGYDPMSATGQLAGGANIICFTTGRGSAFGAVPAPSLKLATNTALWQRQQDDMDFNCGPVVDEAADIHALGRAFYDMVLRCASGEPSKSELYGYGQNEFVPWQPGVIC